MTKYDAFYDEINNKYSYYLFASIKQYDTHVYFDLYEYIVEKGRINDYCTNLTDSRLIKKDVVLNKESFLYFILQGMFLEDRTIVKDSGFRWFAGNIKKIYKPINHYIGGISVKEIIRINTNIFRYVFYIKAIDDEYVLTDLSIPEKGLVIKELQFSKPLFEKFANRINATCNFVTDFSEISYKIKELLLKIEKPLFKRHVKDITNCFEVILKSPTMLTYANIYKILAPTVEGLLRDYFDLSNITLSRSRDLGQIINEININHYFEKDFIELINLVHEPIRNYTMHGHAPSEKVSKFAVLTVLEFYETLYQKMYPF